MTTFIFGEAMLEYHSHGGTGLRYGGDTVNTAIHLARAGHQVTYVTALGTDPISDALIARWASEGIDTRYVLRHPERNPGIYAIHLDEHGERSFVYWRERSAAREMFDLPGMADALAEAEGATLLYFSLISLAIIGMAGRDALLDLAAHRTAAGRTVAYDSNFRPQLWPDFPTSRAVSERAMSSCTIGLPSNNDERKLWGSDEDECAIASRWIDAGADVVAVKAAEKGCVISLASEQYPHLLQATPTEVVDSSGAGDAFNAGFLGAWLQGEAPVDCAVSGQAQARVALCRLGAV